MPVDEGKSSSTVMSTKIHPSLFFLFLCIYASGSQEACTIVLPRRTCDVAAMGVLFGFPMAVLAPGFLLVLGTTKGVSYSLEVKYHAVAKTFGLAFRLSVTRLHQQTLSREINAARRILARKGNVGKLAEEGKQSLTFSWELPNDLIIHVNSNEDGVPLEGRCEKSPPEMGLNIPHEVPEVIGHIKATHGLEEFVNSYPCDPPFDHHAYHFLPRQYCRRRRMVANRNSSNGH
jgi:hypothetical protein